MGFLLFSPFGFYLLKRVFFFAFKRGGEIEIWGGEIEIEKIRVFFFKNCAKKRGYL